MKELTIFRNECAERGADTIFTEKTRTLFVIEKDGTEKTYKCDYSSGTFWVNNVGKTLAL